MNIKSLNIKNFKNIADLHLTTGNSRLIKIFGRNGSGKTSILEAFTWCLFGKKVVPSTCLEKIDAEGETFCETEVEGYLIKRKLTEGKEVLKVSNCEGHAISAPQDFINGLVQPRCINPLFLFGKKESEQQEALQEALGVKNQIEEMQVAYKACFDERTHVNREVKSLEAQYSSIVITDDLIQEEVDIIATSDELQTLQASRQTLANVKRELEQQEKALEGWHKQLEETKMYIEAGQSNVVWLREKLINLETNVNEEAEQKLKDKLSSAQSHNASVVQNKTKLEQKKLLLDSLTTLKIKASDLTELLKKNKSEQRVIFENAKLDNLSLEYDSENGQFLFNGYPLANMSTAERIKLGCRVALLSKNTLRILYVQDGSLLDDESMDFLQQVSEENDMQVWVEIVKSGSNLEVVVTSNDVFNS